MVFNYRLIILLLLLSSTAMGQSLAPSGNYNTLSVFNGGTKSTRAMIAPKGFQPWATYDTTGFIWLDTVNHFLYYHNGTTRVQIGAGGGGSGTVTNVSTGFGMLGGPITTTGTVRVDSNAVMTIARGYKIADSVAGLIPSVSGYQLYTDTNTFDATKANLNAGLAGKQNYTDTSTFDATRSWVTTNYVPYTGATDSVRLGENQIRAGQVAFDLSPTGSQVISGMYWDATNNTISVPLTTDVNLQIGQESLVRARNNTGSTVTNGSVVYISGAQGNNPTIALADADSARTSEVIGVATEDIGINATGFVTVSGVVNGVNTSSWNAGDKLYLSTTNGQLTNTPPTSPHISVLVGTALNSTNNGRIFVSPSQPIATDTNMLNGTTVPPTQYAVKSYVVNSISGKMNYTDTVALSNRINTKQSYSDTTTWDATRSWVTGQMPSLTGYQLYSDTSTFDATRAWVNGRGFGTGSVTSVGSGFGLSGGTITTTGTLRVDTANVPTQYRVDTTAFNALTRINTKGTVSSVALANGFGLSISGSPVTGTGTITATVDTTKVATKADVNAKGSGTVTSIQVVGGTGATVTPTTAVTTSGVYTVTPEVSSATYNTLSNKRWVPRVISAASYTTSVTIPADSVDLFQITAQAGALLFNAPSGTPNNGDLLVIRIKDNGTARALTYNAIFNWSPPSTTVLGKYLVMCFMYNSVTSNWNFMWKRDEP